jgi:apolipoprotein N-acyltransferase
LPVLGVTLFGFFLRWSLLALAEALRLRQVRPLALGLGCLGFLGAASALSPSFAPSSPAVEVAAIQPNVPLEVRWDAQSLGDIEATVWRLTGEAAAKASWVVWPESAVPRLLTQDAAYRQGVVTFAQVRGIWLVLNSIASGQEGEYFNSMFAISPRGELSRYDKVHLVPFGEYVPPWARLPFLRPLVREVGGFTPGEGARLLPGPTGPFAPAVCYEVAFPLHAASQVRQGASLLVTVTNDGWYGFSAAPYQHLALTILRAVENRRYLVRAANTGISAIVDPQGFVLRRLEVGQQGFIHAAVRGSLAVPPAARFAPALHLFPLLAWPVAILLAVRRKARI